MIFLETSTLSRWAGYFLFLAVMAINSGHLLGFASPSNGLTIGGMLKTGEDVMYKSAVVLVGSFVLISVPAFAAKPSFNCSKATHEIEQLICSDDELAALDVSLNDLYKVVMKNTPAAAQKRLKSEQIGWSKGRNDCWKADDKHACVKSEYETRINELKDR